MGGAPARWIGLGLAVLVAEPAPAQDLLRARPSASLADASGLATLTDPHLRPPGSLGIGLAVGAVVRPGEGGLAGPAPALPQSGERDFGRYDGVLLLGWTPLRNLRVQLDVPAQAIWLYDRGAEPSEWELVSPAAPRWHGARLAATVGLVQDRKIAAAITPWIDGVVGTTWPGAADAASRVGVVLSAGGRFDREQATGGHAELEVSVGLSEARPGLRGGLGLVHNLLDGAGIDLDAGMEAQAWLDGSAGGFGDPADGGAYAAEGLFTFTVRHDSGFALTAYAGSGLVRGAGVPLFRGHVVVGFRPEAPEREAAVQRRAPPPEQPPPAAAAPPLPSPDPEGVPAPSATLDRDGDGLPDLEDVCPDLKGPRDLDGCPDTDLDGLVDPQDRCPTRPGPLRWYGCPDPPVADD